MRIITKGVLRDFWENYPDCEQELKVWYSKIRQASYQTPNEVKEDTPSADNVGNNRFVFNICRNKYRLIVVFRYNLQRVYIRFLGTHKEYDTIKDIKNI
jgi:mRNA interferase HigB